MPRGIPNSSQQGNTATLNRQKGQAQQGAQQGITQQQRTGQMGGTTQQSVGYNQTQFMRNCTTAIDWLQHFRYNQQNEQPSQQVQQALLQLVQAIHA